MENRGTNFHILVDDTSDSRKIVRINVYEEAEDGNLFSSPQ